MTVRPPDTTRAERANRREALLNVAAARLGYESWVKLSTAVRQAMESAETDVDASTNLYSLLEGMRKQLPLGQPGKPAADVLAVLAEYPPRKAGRPVEKKSVYQPKFLAVEGRWVVGLGGDQSKEQVTRAVAQLNTEFIETAKNE